MPRQKGEERKYFGGDDGLLTETSASGKVRHYWWCQFCNWELGGQNFPNGKARVHLSGAEELRNGLISNLCPNAPEDVQEKFSKLEHKKRHEAEQKAHKRKRANELLHKDKKAKKTEQSKLGFGPPGVTKDEVDDAWGEAFFGLDMPIAKLKYDLFRYAIEMTKKSGPK